MILISLLNNGKITSSEADSKDIKIVLGFIFKKYIQGEDITDSFDSKCLYVEDEQLKAKSLNRKVSSFIQKKEDSIDVLVEWEKLAKEYEAAYIFDQYEMYQYIDNDYKDLDAQEYELNICKHCGKIIAEQVIDGYCPECFIAYGIQEIFEQVQSDDKELYTEYEAVSKVMNTIDNFCANVKRKSSLGLQKAKEIAEQYLVEEKIPEDLYETILGGFVA